MIWEVYTGASERTHDDESIARDADLIRKYIQEQSGLAEKGMGHNRAAVEAERRRNEVPLTLFPEEIRTELLCVKEYAQMLRGLASLRIKLEESAISRGGHLKKLLAGLDRKSQ